MRSARSISRDQRLPEGLEPGPLRRLREQGAERAARGFANKAPKAESPQIPCAAEALAHSPDERVEGLAALPVDLCRPWA